MIGIIAENNVCRAALIDILAPLGGEAKSPNKEYDFLLTLNDRESVLVLENSELQKKNLPLPIRAADLFRQVQTFIQECQESATFENSVFVFQKETRNLILKKDGTVFSLTEKENDLLSCLAEVCPTPLSKEALLQAVWKYKPDVETHTLESHIYMLRQKIGEPVDMLIKSTPTGYVLITD